MTYPRRALAVALVWCSGAAFSAEDAPSLLSPFSSAPDGPAPAPWRITGLPNHPPTRFEIATQDRQRLLRVEADKSYGVLVQRVQLPLTAETMLSWRWRVDQWSANTDLRTKAGDDSPAKLCVFFDYPMDALPLGERAALALARTATGEALPTESVCYVWDRVLPKGTVLDNAFSRRVRLIVLESGFGTLPQWRVERRNLLADYRRAFDHGQEPAPAILGVGIAADADNTQGHSLAWFGDVALRERPPAGVEPPVGAAAR